VEMQRKDEVKRPLPGAATVVIEQRRQNGEEVQMAPEHSAMRADFTTLS